MQDIDYLGNTKYIKLSDETFWRLFILIFEAPE